MGARVGVCGWVPVCLCASVWVSVCVGACMWVRACVRGGF